MINLIFKLLQCLARLALLVYGTNKVLTGEVQLGTTLLIFTYMFNLDDKLDKLLIIHEAQLKSFKESLKEGSKL